MEGRTDLRWSNTFTILPPSSASNKPLPGDKINLPQTALEQILAAASTSGDPSSFINSRGFGQESQTLPNPLTFRLVNPKNNSVVYAGIREFSAPEGTMELSSFLREALGIEDDRHVAANVGSDKDPIDLTSNGSDTEHLRITVNAFGLPKGTYVRLRPLEAGYLPNDWRPILERQLQRSFTSLTKNTVLSVEGTRGEQFKLLVDKLLPAGEGICVVDTDLEVDFEALDEEQARETMRQLIAKGQSNGSDGSSKGGEIDIWKAIDGHVRPGDYVDYILPSWDKTQIITISLSGIADEDALDLFVTPRSRQQRALPRDDTHVFGNFAPAKDGEKNIAIPPTNVELDGVESLLISIHGFLDPKGKAREEGLGYTLRAQVSPASGTANKPIEIEMDDEHSAEEEKCKNCMQWVPRRTMVLHQSFCLRNNVSCQDCGAVFKKGSAEWDSHWHCPNDDAHGNTPLSKAKHEEIFHTDRNCTGCEFSTNSLADLARHRTSVCPEKIILCRFCQLEVPQEGDPFNPSPEVMLSGMTAHELQDGSRTTECHLCDKVVRLRDMETHLKHHELDKNHRQTPVACRNMNCGRTLYGVESRGHIGTVIAPIKNPGNEIGLCSICFGPLYVSMHDPEGKALIRRIERRYLGQLMTGCKKDHCANEWCKTGRSNANLEPKTSPTQGVMSLVKPLLPAALDPGEPASFCTDESSQSWRKRAEALWSEQVWDLGWCVAAAEFEKGNLDRMRDWLQAWAPRR